LDDICAVSISASLGSVCERAVTADFVALRAASRSMLVAADVLKNGRTATLSASAELATRMDASAHADAT
jgi:hypothetical protein